MSRCTKRMDFGMLQGVADAHKSVPVLRPRQTTRAPQDSGCQQEEQGATVTRLDSHTQNPIAMGGEQCPYREFLPVAR